MSSTLFGFSGDFDVIVIGGGPAGATTAALLAKRGHRVLVLDRERFPRYHVGESLIPGVMVPMEELGLKERMEAKGFERKYGGTLVWGNNEVPWNFSFTTGGRIPYAFHTRRADLDALILDRARELGAFVVEDATVKESIEEDGRVVGVRYALRGLNEIHEARASLVVDASGQARVLGRKYSEVNWNEQLRNVAVWTYFDNCHRLPGDEWSNILIEGTRDGWFWGIPIDKGVFSVGYVTRSELASASDKSLEALFESEIAHTTKLKDLLKDATQAAGYRSARDWSYTNERFHGNGWVLVGDAAAFVDPLFSTGVALATLAASTLSKVVDQILRHPEIEEKALDRYSTAYQDFFHDIRRFVESFYDRSKTKGFYFNMAQDMIDPDKKNDAEVDFVKLISGLSGRQGGLFELNLDDLIEDATGPSTAGH
ncbi:FAD-dependent oxidoreductase [Streptomyces sp. NBC_00873]|uniref:NAD(P)/FAD-dependent oxidoreductase n=1 Tax=unclassified Streptomyces TaxID=2593676 RepID=UPI003864FE73|nr:FAD-dependent oxidoreductase [Streptomyces sp. NBC_00873]WSY96716.1 FAD-dependent oxidoreductase [Streptomyces sp. NBC_00873]WTA41510.1 FAD-dependent oxidoreductase [Streptomyces sp. NBC_00842]WTA48386.1 FAD-dependent oxidoreductase [Streptomyces sp. NBC_00842]